MAYLYHPEHATEVTITIDVKLSGGGTRNESVRFESKRDGKEITNQLGDTVLSAMHLACAVRSGSASES